MAENMNVEKMLNNGDRALSGMPYLWGITYRGRMIINQLKAESYCASFFFFWFQPGKREKMNNISNEKTLG